MKTPQTITSVLETRDYSMFRPSDRNRPVEPRPGLAESLTANGWIPSMPMSVKKNGVGFVILDGQHRFEEAKRVGIPVRYVVLAPKEAFEPSEINQHARTWGIKDYIACEIKRGNTHYAQLRDFHDTTGLEYRICASILGGQQAASGNKIKAVKDGSFRVTSMDFARKIAAMVDACAPFVKWARKSHFVDALSKCACVPDFSAQQFIDRVNSTPGMLTNCPTADAFLDMIEEIYNHRSRTGRVALAFAAREIALKRNAAIQAQRRA